MDSVPDVRSARTSDGITIAYQVEAHLRDLDAVLTAAAVESTALLGYYHSVATAIAFAAAEPRRVTRMVLFGGAARMRDAMSPPQTQALLSLVAQDWDLFADSAAREARPYYSRCEWAVTERVFRAESFLLLHR